VSRRGGLRPGSGRAKKTTEQDLDRFFIVIWRVLARLMGYGPRDAGYFAAHLVSAERIVLADVEGAIRVASTTIKHHADDLETRIAGLVRKAQGSSDEDPWIRQSEAAIKALLLTGFALLRPDLTDDTRKRLIADAAGLTADLEELGWGEFRSRLEGRTNAAFRSNLPPHDSPLGRKGRRLLQSIKKPPQKK
jgi:hypothetical protein